jgi:hypothetical protein
MSFNNDEMIGQLKFEIEMIEKGRYYPSVRGPRSQGINPNETPSARTTVGVTNR